jgi:hypothetical protein
LTRTKGAHSRAKACVSTTSPAFAAAYTAVPGVGLHRVKGPSPY